MSIFLNLLLILSGAAYVVCAVIVHTQAKKLAKRNLDKTAKEYSIKSKEDADGFIEKLSKKIIEYNKKIQAAPEVYGSLIQQAKGDLQRIKKIKRNFN